MSLAEGDTKNEDEQSLMKMAASTDPEQQRKGLQLLASRARTDLESFCSAEGEQAMRLLLELAASSSEPAVQAGALTAFKAVVTLREGNQTAAGEAAMLRLLEFAESSGGESDVQEEALDALAAVVRCHVENRSKTASGIMMRLLQLAAASPAPDVKTAALRAVKPFFGDGVNGLCDENRSAAGAPAVQLLLQLADTSGDEPEVQEAALETLSILVGRHDENTAAAGAAAVRLLVQLVIPGGARFEKTDETVKEIAGQLFVLLTEENAANMEAAMIASCEIEAASLVASGVEDENDVAAALAMVQSPAGAAVAANVLVAVQEAGNDNGQFGVAQGVLEATANALDQLTNIAQQTATAAAAEASTSPNPAASAPHHLLPTTTKFALASLQARSPETAACNPTCLHHYLSDTDFHKVFGMSADDFGKLPGWKQTDAKKKHHLF